MTVSKASYVKGYGVRIHYLQHVAFEDLANIERWARSEGHAITRTRFHQRERLPAVKEIDWLIILGGPMNVHDVERYAWLPREKAFIEEAIRQKKRVLGICLGAQLIADVLGAPIGRNPEREIGWFPVRRTPESAACPFFSVLPQEFHAFHWHGDTFDIPEGAQRLATSDACANQAFRYGERVLALQFHLETTRESVGRLVRHCVAELVAGPYVQPEEALRAGCAEHIPKMQEFMTALLDAMSQ